MKRAEEAIEQDALHLVSATDANHAELESEHPHAGAGPMSPKDFSNEVVTHLQAAGVVKHSDADEFEWSPRNGDVIVPEQRRIAVYTNAWGQAVIREERAWDDEADNYICVCRDNLPDLIKALSDIVDAPLRRDRPVET